MQKKFKCKEEEEEKKDIFIKFMSIVMLMKACEHEKF